MSIWGRADNPPISFFLITALLLLPRCTSLFLFATNTMSTAPSKRKTRDGSEDAAPARKKTNRKADKADQQPQFVDFGNGGDEKKSKPARKYKDKFAPRPEKEYPSINDLKKRIRDVKRLLNKQDLSADARILQERALAGYENDLEEETKRREKSALISKYHFVRFLGMWWKSFIWPVYLANAQSQQTAKPQPKNYPASPVVRKQKTSTRKKRLVLRRKSRIAKSTSTTQSTTLSPKNTSQFTPSPTGRLRRQAQDRRARPQRRPRRNKPNPHYGPLLRSAWRTRPWTSSAKES